MSSLRNIKVSEVEMDAWKCNIDQYETGLFNSWQWVTSLANEYTTDVYFDFYIGDEVIAKLAGMKLDKGKLKGKHLFFISGPGFKEWQPELFTEALTALRRYAIKNGYARVHINPFEQHVGPQLNIDNYFHTLAREYVVIYSDFTERVKFSYGFKQNAKKAKKAGAVYHTTRSLDVLSRMFELMNATRLTRKAKYGPDYDPMYLLNLNKKSLAKLLETGMGVMHYAEIGGVIHSVQFNIEDNGRIFALLMGSDDSAYHNGIPSFIDLNINQNAFEKGYRYYNMGTIPLDNEGGQGLKKYKMSQGAREVVRYGYYTFFLTYPYKMLNPLMRLSKKLPGNYVFNLLRQITRIFNFS